MRFSLFRDIEDLTINSASLSYGTQVGNSYDDQLKDCRLKLSGQPMASDVTCCIKVVFPASCAQGRKDRL